MKTQKKNGRKLDKSIKKIDSLFSHLVQFINLNFHDNIDKTNKKLLLFYNLTFVLFFICSFIYFFMTNYQSANSYKYLSTEQSETCVEIPLNLYGTYYGDINGY